MNADQPTGKRRVRARTSAADRERLIKEQRASGQTKKAFCRERGINVGTFHGWFKKRPPRAPRFAHLTLPGVGGPVPSQVDGPAPIEVTFPNGVRVRLHHAHATDEAIRAIRKLADLPEARPC